MKNIEETLITIIDKYSCVPMSKESLFSSGGVNETDALMIFIETEIMLGIVIPGAEELSFLRVADYYEYVNNLLSASKK
jgi:acyl carrier protein